jgi:ribosomal protein S13
MSYSSMRFWQVTQSTIHVLLRYEVCWQVTRRIKSMSYSGMRFVDKLHTDYNPCLTLVWGSLTSYTQTTIHVLLRYEVRWQVTHRLQSMSYSGMRFVDKLHTDNNPCLTLVWGLLTSYTQTTIHVLLRYEVRWQVTRRLQSMYYSGMRFVDKLHTDYNPCLTLVWGSLTSYTQTTIHVLLWYEVRGQVTHRLQSMSYSGMRFVDKLHTDYNPCLTLVWGLLTSYTQTAIHVLLWYGVRWQVTHRLQSMSYSDMRFVDKLHTDYDPCLTPVWGSLTSYTQTTIHVLLWYEVRWQVTHRLQSMSYSGMRFVDKLHKDYNPCLTPVWGSLTISTQITIHVLLWYEVRWQATHRLQSMSYSGMRFVDKLHTDYNPCLSLVWGLLTRYTDCNPCLTLVWGLMTSYTQTTIHVLFRYEVCWQVTHRLQSMSYSIMRFVDKLHTNYNPCFTLVWGLLTSYTQTTIHILLWSEACWQVKHRLQSMSYSGMRFVDKLHKDYNPCLTPVWGSLTISTHITIHVLLWYEVRWQVTHILQSMSYSGMRFVDKLHTYYNPCLSLVWGLLTRYTDCNPCLTQVWGLLTSYTQTTIHVLFRYEVCWQVTHRLQSMSYSIMRFVDKLHTDYNPCFTLVWGLLTSYTQTTIHILLWSEVCWQVKDRLQSMSYSGMRFVDKLHTDYNSCLTPVWGLLTSYTQITIHVLLWYEVRWQVTHRLQSMSYSGLRFVDKLHTDYNPWLTPVWGLLTSYIQTTIHVLLR